ncbi:MAG TPA: VWA domain-containing protein [Thermoanaerobaculia bacterium]|nr:VWA domain-containing protein [Thermoanaerobaculia bacterium]
MRKALLVILTLLVAAPSLVADEAKPLDRSERKQRTAALADRYREFLADVEPILSPGERDTFLRLETDPQRDVFIEDFWRRRDIMAGTTNHGARDNYYSRLEFVRENFESVMSDRGRIYLIHGVPGGLVDIRCPQYFVPIQVWYYPDMSLGRDVRLLFFQRKHERIFRLWNPRMDGMKALQSDDIEASGRAPTNLSVDCRDGDALASALGYMNAYGDRIQMKVWEQPKVNEEDVHRVLRSSVIADPKASKMAAEIAVAYPSSDGQKTDAQLTIMVPRAQLQTTAVNGVALYTLDVVGEVLRDGKMWERYRYRFDFPGDLQDEKLPIVIDRPLRPAEYTSRIKLTDTSSHAEAILETPLKVPEMAATEPKPTEETTALASIREDLQSSRAKLRIVPLSEEVISGLQTIQTLITGQGIASVEFWLDGKKVATRRSPPYKLDLDFGTVPRARRIRVVALDSHGAPITGDEVVVNTGTDPFRVRIASPRIAPKLSGPTKVEIDVKVPEGKELGNVELYWNETRVATLFDPPFVQTVNIPGTDGVGYLRAVATLKDPEIDPVEDVVMVNTPEYMATVDVHLVELPTTVLRDGKPVNTLGEDAFKVLDEGQPVKLAKFEHVKDLPLSIGMAVDTSGSMDERMATAREAGAAFFQNVLRKGDKAFLVAFDSQPHIVQKWSPELKDIYSGLAKMRAEESTALYDAVVYSLYNFSGVKGQKALVLVTDGKDTASKFTFEQTLEYAQRAAVPIYAIGIGIRSLEMDTKLKLNRFTAETGGSSYYIENVSELSAIYRDIQNELRSQYVLGFYPAAEVKPGGKWREVTVQTAEGKVKTIRGYYP